MDGREFASRLIFSDEAIFLLSGKVNRHNVFIWGIENLRHVIEHGRDSPEVNVFLRHFPTEEVRSVFLHGKHDHRDYMSERAGELAFPLDYIFQQDGTPPHFQCEDPRYLSEILSYRWFGRASATDLSLLSFSPRSLDVTRFDFFLWGYVKDTVYRPPLPHDLQELRQRIIIAVTAIEEGRLAGESVAEIRLST
jgi:hypothetical protein